MSFSPEKVKELLPILTAYAEGKPIQIRKGEGWTDLDRYSFTSPVSDYRIKPEPVEVKKWLVLNTDNHTIYSAHEREEHADALLSGPARAARLVKVEVTGSYER